MGIWDSYCFICGGPSYFMLDCENYKEYYNSDTKWVKSNLFKWLSKCTVLLPNGKKYSSCSGADNMLCKNKVFNIMQSDSSFFLDFENIKNLNEPGFGIFLHNDCYKYIKQKTNYNIAYKNIPTNKMSSMTSGLIDLYKYKFYNLDNYHEQFYDFNKMIHEKNYWRLISPLSKTKDGIRNSKRIDKILSQLKLTKSEIVKRNKRLSPPISATFIEKNTIGLGNDKNLWIINNNKWNKLLSEKKKLILLNLKKDSLKWYNKDQLKLFKIIFFKEQLSFQNNPIFIESIKNINTKTLQFNIISTKKGIANLIKKINMTKLEYKLE